MKLLVAASEEEALILNDDGTLSIRTPKEDKPTGYKVGKDIDGYATACFKWNMWRVAGPDGFYPDAPPQGLPPLKFSHTEDGEPVFVIGESKCEDCDEDEDPIIDVPDFRQKDNYDCGAAATHSVAAYFLKAIGETEDDFIQALGTNPQDGTSAEAIQTYLANCGLEVIPVEGMDLDILAEAIFNKLPVIAAIQDYGTPNEENQDKSGHWVVVIGVRDGGILTLQDPSAGRVDMSGDEFAERWHDKDTNGKELINFGIIVKPLPEYVPKAWKPLAHKSPEPLAKAIQGFFRKQAKAVLKHLPTLPAKAPHNFDTEKWAKEMAKEVMPTAQILYDHAAKEAAINLVGREHTEAKLKDGRTVEFTKHPQDRGIMVMVDPKKLDKVWSKDSGYIPPGGGGAEIGGRRQGFTEFLDKKKPIEASKVYLHDGKLIFDDGRHRFSVLRDQGANKVAVMVPRDQIKEFTKKFAATVADPFGVVQPGLIKAMEHSVLKFCQETNETTSQEIGKAIEDLRAEIADGLIQGDVKNAMMERVKQVFDNAENDRAWRIATTEASRGQHQAAIMTAQETGLNLRKVWLLSSDACEECKPLNGKAVGLEEDFVIEGTGPYSRVTAPPLHPHCRCDMYFEES